MSFNAGNYRLLRAELLTREGKFNWLNGIQYDTESACVACACLRLEGRKGKIASDAQDIERFLGCTELESLDLYVGWRGANFLDVHAAIARLDEVAARYGVRPEPHPLTPKSIDIPVISTDFQPNESAYLAELREFVADVTVQS